MVEELLFIFDQTLVVIIVRVEVFFRENGEAVVCNEHCMYLPIIVQRYFVLCADHISCVRLVETDVLPRSLYVMWWSLVWRSLIWLVRSTSLA